MKIADYVTLLKAGMTLDEIRQREADEAVQPEPETQPETQPETKPEQQPETQPETEPEPDYKAMYEAQVKELTEKNQTIKDLQQQNTQENIKPDNVKSDSEIFEEALRSFM